jgi:hypothetical protein
MIPNEVLHLRRAGKASACLSPTDIMPSPPNSHAQASRC